MINYNKFKKKILSNIIIQVIMLKHINSLSPNQDCHNLALKIKNLIQQFYQENKIKKII